MFLLFLQRLLVYLNLKIVCDLFTVMFINGNYNVVLGVLVFFFSFKEF